MESQANYVATGAFVLLVLAGMIAAAAWLAGAQLNAHYEIYETHILGSVSGLDAGAPVKLNGIAVGRVASMQQDAQNPADVNVLLQIRPDATIHSDSVASLEMAGLTGGRYIEITGGTLASPKLMAGAGQRYPTVSSRRSSLDALFDNAPQLVNKLNVIADRLQALLNDRNRQAISSTLSSLDDLTTRLDHRSRDLDHLVADGGVTLHNLAKASATLDDLMQRFQGTPLILDRLLASADLTFARTTRLADNIDEVVRTSRPGLHELTSTIPARLDTLLTTANRLTETLNRLSAELERNPSSVLFGASQQGYRPR